MWLILVATLSLAAADGDEWVGAFLYDCKFKQMKDRVESPEHSKQVKADSNEDAEVKFYRWFSNNNGKRGYSLASLRCEKK